MPREKVKIGKGMSLPRGKLEKVRKEPGKSNAGSYKNVAKSDFAGPDGTYPINTLKRARAALSYAHNSENPSAIKRKVYAKYPALKKRSDERKKKEK